MEDDALIEVPNMRRFAGIDITGNQIHDETTILENRHQQETHNLG